MFILNSIFKSQTIEKKVITNTIILLIFLNVMVLGGQVIVLQLSNHTTVKNQNLQNQKTSLTQTQFTPQVQQSVAEALSKFTGGFIPQEPLSNPSTGYSIGNPSMSVDFEISTVKMNFMDNSKVNNPIITEISQKFVNSNTVVPSVTDPIMTHTSYFIGTNIGTTRPSFARLWYKNIYNNIDLEYTLKDGQLKYNFIIHPGGNPNDIQMEWNGPVQVQKTSEGMQITIQTAVGKKTIIDNSPVAMQNGIDIQSNIEFFSKSLTSYGFSLSHYDTTKTLVIDPTIIMMSTYLGGPNYDVGRSVAIDNQGNIYVTGYTGNTSVSSGPTNYNVFVYKLSGKDYSLIYGVTIGGSADDYGMGIATDINGTAFVTGYTASTNFPVMNPFQANNSGGYDVFVFRLSSDGTKLLYSTLIGGTGDDIGNSIVLDNYDNIFVTGSTRSANFPTYLPYDNTSYSGGADVFVFKLSESTGLLYSRFLGGSADDFGNSIALNNIGEAYVTGYTYSTDFPMINSFYPTNTGQTDVIIFRLSISGSLVYSTYFGGIYDDQGNGIAIDSKNDIIVTGYTTGLTIVSTNTFGVSSTYSGTNVFVLKLAPSGQTMLFSDIIGGSTNDVAFGIVLNIFGDPIITGITTSFDFPNVDGYLSVIKGAENVFVLQLTADGSTIVFSSIIGGSYEDTAFSIALDSFGFVYVAGYTNSIDFPTTANALSKTFMGGGADAFLFKIGLSTSINLVANIRSINPYTSLLSILWNPPHYTQGLLHYNVYRTMLDSAFAAPKVLLGSTNKTFFMDTNVTPGADYDYFISAVYTFGEGPLSSPMQGKYFGTAPTPPRLFLINNTDYVDLEWGPNLPFDGGFPILRYDIFRGSFMGQYSIIGSTINLHYYDNSGNPGVKYYYVVTAVNAIGSSKYSNEVVANFTLNSSNNAIGSSGAKSTPGFESLSTLGFVVFVSLITILKRRNRTS